MTCPNHRPVPCRELHFQMAEDSHPFMKGHLVRATTGGGFGHAIVEGHTDGLGCPTCGSFEPAEKPDAHV